MVLKIKQKVFSHLRQHLNCEQINYKSIKTMKLLKHSLNDRNIYSKPKFYIDLNDFYIYKNNKSVDEKEVKNSISKLSFIKQIDFDENETKSHLMFEIEEQFYVKQLIDDLKLNNLSETYGKNTLMSSGLGGVDGSGTVVTEFSSPNIAKPFHVGNYRSTIIGNFVANLHEFCGHNVIRLNYLGDFGTQFGILSLAFDYFGNDKSLAENPLKHLFEVYVKGSSECKDNEEWRQLAKNRFNLLETKQSSDVLKQWQKFRELSVDKLKGLYQRLGIRFDEFHSESMYSMASLKVIEELRKLGLIEADGSGAQFALIRSNDPNKGDLKIPVIKSDGSTLYLTRDIAAAIHRKELYNFKKMFYIVDNSQSKHFNNLFGILSQTKYQLSDRLIHLRFGRIVGMSTRNGNIIFLEDVLNEAKDRAVESCNTSLNTKISEDKFDSVADVLGMSALLVYDLIHRRVTDYRFDWDLALRHTGNTGIALQYSHARLCSLESNCGYEVDLDLEPNITALNEFEAKLLINVLSQFDEVLIETYENLEPSILVLYLFDLRNAINRCHLVLKVKGQEPEVANTRLLLFYCARNVLQNGMKILGLNPLNSM